MRGAPTGLGLAERHGFGESDAGRVALVATELATNLIKHAGGGELLVGSYEVGGKNGVELLALDRGPGMANVSACLADGFSTGGTRGQGLGAVTRQSNFFDVATWPGVGTAILARIRAGRIEPDESPAGPGWGAVSIAMPGEQVCGDSWTVHDAAATRTLMVADGLGHGEQAAEASVEAVRAFHRFSGHQVPALLDYIHGALRATRGAAVSIARFDPATRRIVYAGVGNVAGVIASRDDLKHMVSMPGTAGFNARKIQAFEYAFEGGLVILHSDGLSTSWTLNRYPNIAAADPTLIAAVLYRDFGRRRDDATVVVGKWTRGS